MYWLNVVLVAVVVWVVFSPMPITISWLLAITGLHLAALIVWMFLAWELDIRLVKALTRVKRFMQSKMP